MVRRPIPDEFDRHVRKLDPQAFEDIDAGELIGPVIGQEQHLPLQQILQCPYRHETKRLFLESKALELLALQLEQWLVLEQGERSSQSLKAADVERVYGAADILLKELSHPPSILALAHRVGLNEHKLKVGFRQVFETTVFGYVRAQRLERARQLLLAGDVTVTQAALTVGYASQGHFAAAFRRRFGVNPRSLRCH